MPAITAKETPSRRASIATAVASRALRIFVGGYSIDPEQSTMSTTPAFGVARAPVAEPDSGWPPVVPPPVEVTVTTALTSRPPSGRYSFW